MMSDCKSWLADLAFGDLRFDDSVSQRIRQFADSSSLHSVENPVYVDWANKTDTENRSSVFPDNSMLAGVLVVIPGGTLQIDAGVYPERIVANRPMILNTTGGAVRIGPLP